MEEKNKNLTDEQLSQANAALNRPWYDPLVRVGEASAFVKMPFVLRQRMPWKAQESSPSGEGGLSGAMTPSPL